MKPNKNGTGHHFRAQIIILLSFKRCRPPLLKPLKLTRSSHPSSKSASPPPSTHLQISLAPPSMRTKLVLKFKCSVPYELKICKVNPLFEFLLMNIAKLYLIRIHLWCKNITNWPYFIIMNHKILRSMSWSSFIYNLSGQYYIVPDIFVRYLNLILLKDLITTTH